MRVVPLFVTIALLFSACFPNHKKEVIIETWKNGKPKIKYVYGLSDADLSFTKEVGYYKSGCLKYIGFRSKGKRDSNWTQWYDSSRKVWELHQFKNDLRMGWLCRWYENGNPRSRMHFVFDKRWGKHTEWYENSKLRLKGQWRNDKMTGHWVYWYENGNKEKEGNYCRGDWEKLSMFSGKYPDFVPLKDSVWIYYDSYGKIIRKETWKTGKILCVSFQKP
jgi:antitoxin component YwqK of YwqJK toxin-antitoxin module